MGAVQREYGAMAARYDARWQRYVERTTTLALDALSLEAGTVMLDVGCGTGVLLQRALERETGQACIGIDITEAMLRQAARRLPATVMLLRGSGTAVPLASASVDAVVSTSALHFMHDPALAVSEWYRVLRPSGVLVVCDWCTDYRTMRWLDRVLRLFNPAHERALNSAQLTALLADAGFCDVAVSRTRIDRFWGMMTAHSVR